MSKIERVMRVGRLGAVLALCVACDGKMRSLGELDAVGGAADGDTSTAGTGGGLGNGGLGNGGLGNGGARSALGIAGIGGTPIGLTGTGAAGAGVAGSGVGVVSYVQAPSLPIDPTCTCSGANQICNAARQCVPRCDSGGRCAMWMAPHAVLDILVDGAAIFFLVAPASDPLGNPTSGGSLYRANFGSAEVPKLIALGITDLASILGRHNGATYIYAGWPTNNVIRVTDSGTTTIIANNVGPSPMMRGNWMMFGYYNDARLWGLDLKGDLAPKMLVEPPSTVSVEGEQPPSIEGLAILDDYIAYIVRISTGPWQVCHIPLADLAVAPTCSTPWSIPYGILAAGGNQMFGAKVVQGAIESLDYAGNPKLKLLSVELGTYVWGTTYDNGWLYSVVNKTKQLVRYPTSVGRLPQEVLPASVVQPAFFSLHGSDNAGGDFAVGSTGVFWVQDVSDKNLPQYIFHAPLPTQPCDSELPCSGADQICVNGSCVAEGGS